MATGDNDDNGDGATGDGVTGYDKDTDCDGDDNNDDDDGNDDGGGRRRQRGVLNERRRRRRGGSENPVRWASWVARIPAAPRGDGDCT